MEFFRHCPECGRRFHIKLESKNLVSGHREEFWSITSGTLGVAPRALAGGQIAIDIDEYLYNYKCSACGHEWSETRVEDEPE